MNFFGVNIPDPIPGTAYAQEYNKALNSAKKVSTQSQVKAPIAEAPQVPANVTSARIVDNTSMSNLNEVADFAQSLNDYGSQFNSAEAEKNRQWQEYMSNTAHQREVEDLKKAGLNPVLSAGGYGADFSSVGNASYENNAQSVLGYMSQLLNSETSLKTAQIMANAQLGSAAMSSSASRYNTDLYTNVLRDNNNLTNLSGVTRSLVYLAGKLLS